MRDDKRKKLVLSKTTIKNLSVRTGIKTGLLPYTAPKPTTECEYETDGCGGGGGDDTANCPPTCLCRGYPFTGAY